MKVHIEVLAISEPREWGDRQVAFKYNLGMRGDMQMGWMVETINDDWLWPFMLSEILAQHVNCTRPQGPVGRWL